MILIDVNVLVYAHREECERHEEFRHWLEDLWTQQSSYGVCDTVLSGCLRVLTHPRVFNPPTPLKQALAFINQVRGQENAVVISPGSRHWEIFTSLCKHSDARGNLVPDAYLAALAIESGSEWITTDRDYSRFPGLSWRHPFSRTKTRK